MKGRRVSVKTKSTTSKPGTRGTMTSPENPANRFAAIFNIPRNATIDPEVEYSVYYSELPGC